MASYKGYSIAIVLLLIQTVVCHPLPSPAKEPDAESIALFKEKFETAIPATSYRVVQSLREMLKDEKFVNSNDSDIKTIRNNLTEVVKQYDNIEKRDQYAEFLLYFATMLINCMDVPENRITAPKKFMEDLLSKYGLTKLSFIKSEKDFKKEQ